MTPGAIAVWVVTGVSVAGAVLLVLAWRAAPKENSLAVLCLGAGLTFLAWAAVGWAWWLTGRPAQ